MVSSPFSIADDRAKIRSVAGWRFDGRDCDAEAIRADAVHRSPSLTGTSISYPSLAPCAVSSLSVAPGRITGSSVATTGQTGGQAVPIPLMGGEWQRRFRQRTSRQAECRMIDGFGLGSRPGAVLDS